MGGTFALAAAAALLFAYPPAPSQPATGGQHVIVDFDRRANADTLARELCLRFACEIRHVYRYLPGMAVTGGNLTALERAPGVLRVTPDLAVTMERDAPVLIGAPSHGPLAIVGGGLETHRVRVERTWRYAEGVAPAPVLRRTTELVAPLVARMPSRSFWTFNVLAASGEGRLSDVLAAMEQIVSLRFAVGAIYIPLALHGEPSPRLCVLTDEILRRGLLVITGIDQACSPSAE